MIEQLEDFKKQLEHTFVQLKEDFKTIRTGRASPSLVEDCIIEAYQGQSKLKLMELATITNEGPSTLSIIPFDPSTISDIEKGILKLPLGFSPRVQGTKIVLRIPPLSQEQREKMVKLIGQKVEEHRNIMRNMRDEMRKKIKNQFGKKTITEDDKFRNEKEVDTITSRYMSEIQSARENKEQEIMEV